MHAGHRKSGKRKREMEGRSGTNAMQPTNPDAHTYDTGAGIATKLGKQCENMWRQHAKKCQKPRVNTNMFKTEINSNKSCELCRLHGRKK